MLRQISQAEIHGAMNASRVPPPGFRNTKNMHTGWQVLPIVIAAKAKSL